MKFIVIAYWVIALTLFAGWVSNIVQLCGYSFDSWTTTMVVKAVGIIMGPVGSVMGIIGWF